MSIAFVKGMAECSTDHASAEPVRTTRTTTEQEWFVAQTCYNAPRESPNAVGNVRDDLTR